MTENEFMLQDRITKIKSVNEQHDLEHNAYISFSGGKDSTVLSVLIDEALPGNKIPRVYVDTKLDYKMVRDFALEKVKNDDRFVAVTHHKNIKQSLNEDGYPFKSKTHSRNVMYRQNGLDSDYLRFYFRKNEKPYTKASRQCPKSLEYQWDFNDFKISDKCCINMKEEPLKEWQKENKKLLYISGIRSAEGGRRAMNSGCIQMNGDHISSFNPLFVVSDNFMTWYINERNIKLAELYYPPYNFERTGCKGCPFALNLREDLETMRRLLPNEAKQCEYIWKPVYEEYRRIGFRLPKDDDDKLFDW